MKASTKLFLQLGVFVAALAGYTGVNTNSALAAACAPPADYGSATQTITVPTSGTYRVWSRIKAPDATNNSYMLQIDGTTCYTVGNSAIAANTWTWVDYQNGTTTSKVNATLTAGSHTIVMFGNEPNVQLDRVVFTTDTACVPSGTGDNCASPPDTIAPVVSVTAPANNASITGTVSVTANATDDVAVSRVEFYIDGTLKGTDTSSPYAYSLVASTLTPGTHTISAKAYDPAGNVTTSTIINVNVADTTSPSVSVTAPTGGSSVSGTIAFSANATDNVAVSKVEFYTGSTLRGTDTTAPYSISLDSKQLANGAVSLTVKAFDAANNSTTSSAVSVTVNNTTTPPVDTTPPTVSISSPTDGASVSGSVNIGAVATDNIGVSKVEFYVDGALKNSDTTAPFGYSLNTSTLTNASHVIMAKAFDAANNSVSSSVSVTVNNATFIREDINTDGRVNLLDFSILSGKFGQTTNLGRADINGDGVCNLLDFSLLAGKFGS